MASYRFASRPSQGEAIAFEQGELKVPDNPVIPFVEGDGTGPDIWRASVRVFDAAVEKAYGGKRKIHWMEVYAGEKSFMQFKAAYEKLENANESAARKFRAKKLQLDDQYRDGKPTNESKFIADCDSTKDKILELLRNPENQ